jgi:hypothetical protein
VELWLLAYIVVVIFRVSQDEGYHLVYRSHRGSKDGVFCVVVSNSSHVVLMKKMIIIAEFEVDSIQERNCLGDF